MGCYFGVDVVAKSVLALGDVRS